MLRHTPDERQKIEFMASVIGCSLNDALRICIWRGATIAEPQETDAEVLGAEAVQAAQQRWARFVAQVQAQPGPAISPDQTMIEMDDTTEE